MILLPRLKGGQAGLPMPKQNSASLTQQLGEQRRTVDFDSFDIQLQELLRMLEQGQILVAPAYQRRFRWDNARCSQLMESLCLAFPSPIFLWRPTPTTPGKLWMEFNV